MAIREREYLFSANKFQQPIVRTQQRAIGLLLIRLILLDPGSDPLHPEMGVGIRRYRYGMDNLNNLTQRVKEQIDTYLLCFPASDVTLVQTPDHYCNIEITINDTVYIYNSQEAPIPITLENITEQ